MDGVLWDLGFGVGWPQNGVMGHRDGWVPMGSEIWGLVAPKWRYGVRDEWDPISSEIWGRVDQRWSYGVRDEDGDGWDPIRSGIWD